MWAKNEHKVRTCGLGILVKKKIRTSETNMLLIRTCGSKLCIRLGQVRFGLLKLGYLGLGLVGHSTSET